MSPTPPEPTDPFGPGPAVDLAADLARMGLDDLAELYEVRQADLARIERLLHEARRTAGLVRAEMTRRLVAIGPSPRDPYSASLPARPWHRRGRWEYRAHHDGRGFERRKVDVDGTGPRGGVG